MAPKSPDFGAICDCSAPNVSRGTNRTPVGSEYQVID